MEPVWSRRGIRKGSGEEAVRALLGEVEEWEGTGTTSDVECGERRPWARQHRRPIGERRMTPTGNQPGKGDLHPIAICSWVPWTTHIESIWKQIVCKSPRISIWAGWHPDFQPTNTQKPAGLTGLGRSELTNLCCFKPLVAAVTNLCGKFVTAATNGYAD